MKMLQKGKVSYLASQILEAQEPARPNICLRHGFSTRMGGVSTAEHLKEMNFGFRREEPEEITVENYAIFAKALAVQPSHVVCTNQTHTSRVIRVNRGHWGMGWQSSPNYDGSGIPDRNETDALVTDVPDVALAVRAADCVPILLWDPVHCIIGAAHAGWRGTQGRIAENTVREMTACGAEPATIFAAIGPAIGVCCYEVDDAFYELFLDTFGTEICRDCFCRERKKGETTARWHADLRCLNRIVLEQTGVAAEHIDLSLDCTCCQPNLFHSHRATGGKRGTMAAVISMETVEA